MLKILCIYRHYDFAYYSFSAYDRFCSVIQASIRLECTSVITRCGVITHSCQINRRRANRVTVSHINKPKFNSKYLQKNSDLDMFFYTLSIPIIKTFFSYFIMMTWNKSDTRHLNLRFRYSLEKSKIEKIF